MDITTVELSGYELEDLTKARKRIDKEIKLRQMEQARIARKAIRETAREYGFNLNDLINTPKSESRTRTVRFRHPEDRSKTWGGRGRKPAWVREWQDAGGSLDDLRVER